MIQSVSVVTEFELLLVQRDQSFLFGLELGKLSHLRLLQLLRVLLLEVEHVLCRGNLGSHVATLGCLSCTVPAQARL